LQLLLAGERVAGSYTRTLIRRLPEGLRARFRSGVVTAEDPPLEPAETGILSVLAGWQRFAPVVDDAWTPPLGREQSLESVLRWLERG